MVHVSTLYVFSPDIVLARHLVAIVTLQIIMHSVIANVNTLDNINGIALLLFTN